MPTTKEVLEDVANFYMDKGYTKAQFIKSCHAVWEEMKWLRNGIE